MVLQREDNDNRDNDNEYNDNEDNDSENNDNEDNDNGDNDNEDNDNDDNCYSNIVDLNLELLSRSIELVYKIPKKKVIWQKIQ